MRLGLAHPFDEAEAVQARHVDVGDDDVRRSVLELLQAVEAVAGLHHAEARFLQRAVQHGPDGGGIVHCQHGLTHRTGLQMGLRRKGPAHRKRAGKGS